MSDLASQLQLPLMTLLTKTDGPKGADFLARKLQRGELTLDDIRRRLAQSPEGSAKEKGGVELHEREQPGSDKPLVMVA